VAPGNPLAEAHAVGWPDPPLQFQALKLTLSVGCFISVNTRASYYQVSAYYCQHVVAHHTRFHGIDKTRGESVKSKVHMRSVAILCGRWGYSRDCGCMWLMPDGCCYLVCLRRSATALTPSTGNAVTDTQNLSVLQGRRRNDTPGASLSSTFRLWIMAHAC
jgi:hypothetical protein